MGQFCAFYKLPEQCFILNTFLPQHSLINTWLILLGTVQFYSLLFEHPDNCYAIS